MGKNLKEEKTNTSTNKNSKEEWSSQIVTIIYQQFPNADWKTILAVYQNQEELFLDALEGAYQLKHQDGIATMEECQAILTGNRKVIFNKIDKNNNQ